MQGTYFCSVICFSKYYNQYMKTKLLLIAACCILTSVLHAKVILTGTIYDAQQETQPGVTVSLLKTADSSLVKAAFTDVNGQYEIEGVTADSFLLSFSAVGFATAFVKGSVTSGADTTLLQPVHLQAANNQLQDVVITSKKPTIEVRADKVVFNVEGSINAAGSNALELLQKSPGVSVDNNDNITLKGRSGVKIYIDGKMSQLDSRSLADYLKSIGSADIEAIEIIANPGAKYDASGSAGVINIRLKKNRKFGANGSLEVGGGKGTSPQPRAHASGNFNYRNKKVNVFGDAGAYSGQNKNDLKIYRRQQDTVYDQHTIIGNEWKSLELKTGADYFLNDKNTIGMVVTSNFSDNTFSTDGSTAIYPGNTDLLVKTLKARNDQPSHRTNTDFNLNYRYVDTNGTEIAFDADYGLFRSQSRSYQPNNYYNPEDVLQYSIINGNSAPTNIDIYTAKLDLEHRLGKGKLGYGAKYAYVKTDNVFDFYNYEEGNPAPIVDLSRSNCFVYTENVNAAYVNYSRTFGSWSLQAGLRAEQTISEGKLTRADGTMHADDDVKRNYLDLFPSAALSYNVSKNHTLGFNYSRRIDRPNYQDLNPFEEKLDQLTYLKGNAFLTPQYTHNFELSYTLMSLVTFSAGYAHVKDYAVTITDTINGNASYLQRRNLASQNVYTFSASSQLPIRKWWNGYINFWCNYQSMNGLFNGRDLSISAASFGGYLQQTFTLGKGYSAEASGWFSGSGIEAAWKREPIGSLDIGVQKRFWNDRANLKLSLSDVFHTQRFNALTDYGGVYMKINQTNESRIFRVNFTYRFGNSQVKGNRQHKTALDSEGSRISK